MSCLERCSKTGSNPVKLSTRLPPGADWSNIYPIGINDRGQITGYGYNGLTYIGFVFTP